jgi:hypothetical protein
VRLRVREESLRFLEGMDDIEKLELLKGDKGEKAGKEDKVEKEEAAGKENCKEQIPQSPILSGLIVMLQ